MEKTMTVKEFYDKYVADNGVLNLEYANMFLEEREAKAFLVLTQNEEICLVEHRNGKAIEVAYHPIISVTYNPETPMSEVFEEFLDIFYCSNRCEANHRIVKDYLIKRIIDMKTISIKDFFEKYYKSTFIPEDFAYMFLDKREAEAFCALLGDNEFTLRTSAKDILIDVENNDEYIFAAETPMSEVFEKILSYNIDYDTAISRIVKEYLNK